MPEPAPTSKATEKAEASVGKFKYPPHPIAAIFPLLDPTSPEFLALDPMIAGPEGGPSSDMQRFED